MIAGELEYALAKQVPDMARGFTIETSFGSIVIEADDAPKIIKAVRAAVQRELDGLKMARPGVSHPKLGVTRHRCV